MKILTLKEKKVRVNVWFAILMLPTMKCESY